MSVDNSVNNRETEPDSLALLLCREERFEYLLLSCFVDANAVVADLDLDGVTIGFAYGFRPRAEAVLGQEAGPVLGEEAGP